MTSPARGPGHELTDAEIAANLRAAAAQKPNTKAAAQLTALADIYAAEPTAEEPTIEATCEGYAPPKANAEALKAPAPTYVEGPVGAAYAHIRGIQGTWRLVIFDADGNELATSIHGSRGRARDRATAMGLEVRP